MQGQVIELARMALNGKQESTSKALSLSLKLLKKKAPLVKLVVSYADKGQKHLGTIYQATNWVYENQSESSTTEYFIRNKWMHSRSANQIIRNYNLDRSKIKKRKASGKIKYLYPLDKNTRKNISKLSKPYLKDISDSSVSGSTLSFQDKSGGSIPTESLKNYG
ncbi:MAG: putative adenine modification enzyme [Prokaryotic dsDNA virus sp.]|nr:MAG: putative adenine modification enzyme [Prokaryotic dsDNA virus sp.]|tara:strand:+ start:7709 stop:8200 length:492 start_codon:yes stop_codon:yes gene_type:complete